MLFIKGDSVFVSLPTPLRVLPDDLKALLDFVMSKVDEYMESFVRDIIKAPGKIRWEVIRK